MDSASTVVQFEVFTVIVLLLKSAQIRATGQVLCNSNQLQAMRVRISLGQIFFLNFAASLAFTAS